MTKQQKIGEVKKRCYEANPKLTGMNSSLRIEDERGFFDGIINYRDSKVRLADVLWAFYKFNINYTIKPSGEFISLERVNETTGEYEHTGVVWGEINNNVEGQSEATINFIHELLYDHPPD